MAAVQPGVTTSFTLNTSTPTQVAGANSSRHYVLMTNNDKSNAVAFAHGTNNGATANSHVIPPGSFYEFGPFEPGWGMLSDISMIAVSGTPTVSYLEL
jgi:hypothetical protein